ncbi:short-chain dehydrogenase/reductase family protein (macronuclear) [Tetrahymena thermophila SB210]|uniref:Short-chain dehydrogenase/reductase family protein n=1 Tax=Tetrahymena thermophila (strain SB210) TaxID=312017 RepID=I7M264_TETTS|nr:short-chain dehydrogenase/reductase family protein [Tetrahymena thermophila SB210]EAR99402.1 short-chain dehydrogenase/reductase family protein [Tetrahymena thermophila SB210]|eukprot:XP_001019647.1 short-chain dehydrogenase/reductase family protein [Tetrahymena thermophila SB210]
MYAIRAIQFIIKGKSEFTNKGFAKNKVNFNEKDTQVDLSGQHIIITGANSGIGYSAALQLAQKGAFIHLVCRNKQRGEEALQNLQKEISNNKNVQLHLCDMSDFSSIRKFVDEYNQLGVTLDGLVQNAGTMIHERQTTKDGLEYNFATNVAGVFLMNELFVPLLEKTYKQTQRNPKIILVSSGGMYTQKLEADDLNMSKEKKFDGQAQYAKNKRQQVVLCEKWTKLYTQSKGIQFYSMHPGWVDTPVLPQAMPDFYKRFKDDLRKCEEGSDTIFWLQCMPASRLESGGFYFDRKSVPKHLSIACTSHDQKEVDKLYNKLVDITKI